MLLEERWKRIMEIIQEKKVVSVSELSKYFDTSVVTIRRDLHELEKTTDKIRRTHGGAIWSDFAVKGTNYEPLYPELESSNKEIKEEICVAAAKLLRDNIAIIIDSSTTAKQLCNLILQNPPKGLMVVTNSVRVAMMLDDCPSVETILTGGKVRKGIVSCTGRLAESAIKQMRVDKAFLGINGIDLRQNVLTMPSMTEGAVKTDMIESAKETIILADHTKFDTTYIYKVCNASDVSLIITDKGVSQEEISLAKECGVNLVVA
jgi:DeoR family fructose operon transcriptional repressor